MFLDEFLGESALAANNSAARVDEGEQRLIDLKQI